MKTIKRLGKEANAEIVLQYLMEIYNTPNKTIKAKEIKTTISTSRLSIIYEQQLLERHSIYGERYIDHVLIQYIGSVAPNIQMATKIVEAASVKVATAKKLREKKQNAVEILTPEKSITMSESTTTPLSAREIKETLTPSEIKQPKIVSLKNLEEDVKAIKELYEEQFGVKIHISIAISHQITL